MLPTPEVVLHERVLLCENALEVDSDLLPPEQAQPAGVCGVLQLAASRAVGCEPAAPAEPALILSPDGQCLAVREPGGQVRLLSGRDGFRELTGCFTPPPVTREDEVCADAVLGCCWSSDSALLLVACASSAVYLLNSSGSLLALWDTSWPWARGQLVAACHGPADTLLLLTAARVLYLVDRSSGSTGGGGDLDPQQKQQLVLGQFSVKRCHASVRALGFDEKSALAIIAGDGGGAGGAGGAARPGAGGPAAAAFGAEGVTVSAWQLKGQQLSLKFSHGAPKAGPGLLASTAAGLLGVDGGASAAAAAARWSISFSPLQEHVALLTGAGSVYILSLPEGRLVEPEEGFAGRAAGGSGDGAAAEALPGGSLLGPKVVQLTPAFGPSPLEPLRVASPSDGGAAAASAGDGAGGAAALGNKAVGWWGPRVLAVAAADGSVALARLPGSVNILGAAPARFAPGSRVAAMSSGHKGLLVLEPITAATAAATRAGGSAPGSAGAPGLSATALELAFSADASAGAGGSLAMLLARQPPGALPGWQNGGPLGPLGGASEGGAGGAGEGAPPAGAVAGWLARRLGVADEVSEAAARAGAASAGSRLVGWRLALLAERTPQQLLQVHLRCQDWGSAFHLCRAYSLDQDLVYRARWAASPVGRATISDNLPKMRDRRGVVAECLSRTAPDYESARLLISYGLRETAKWAAPPAAAAAAAAAASAAAPEFATPAGGRPPTGPGAPPRPPGPPGPRPPGTAPAPSPGGLTALAPGAAGAAAAGGGTDLLSLPRAPAEEVCWWRLQRLKLLQLHDRLEASVALSRGGYNPAVFESLRHESPESAAAALASSGHVAGLQLLLQRHRAALQPRLLALLSALPESLDPRTYGGLLPRAAVAAPGPGGALSSFSAAALKPAGVGSALAGGTRRVDWVESEETLGFLLAAAAGRPPVATAAGGEPQLFSAALLPRAPSPDAEGGAFGSPLQSASSLDASPHHIAADEAAAMLRGTEEMERLMRQQQQRQQRQQPEGGGFGSGSCGPSDQQIAEWIAARALQLDTLTGQLPAALQLLDLGVTKGYGAYTVSLRCSAGPSAGGGGAVPTEQVVSISSLLEQTQVLSLLLRSWWPAQQETQQQGQQQEQQGQEWEQQQPGDRGEPQPHSPSVSQQEASAAAAATAAAAAALPPAWAIALEQWLSAGLLAQLVACLGGSSADLLQDDLTERALPLLSCHSHAERVAALRQLLVSWVAGGGGSGGASGGGKASGGGPGITLAVALMDREAELLRGATGGAGGGLLRLPEGGPAWDGDAAACVAAAMAAVAGCGSTSQWAKLEQLLDAAASLLAAAAGDGAAALRLGPGAGGSPAKEPQHGRRPPSRGGKSAGPGSVASGWEGHSEAEAWSGSETEEWQEPASPSAASIASSVDAQVQAIAEAQAVRQAMAAHPLAGAQLHELAAQLAALRGRVRAARLLCKHGCSVTSADLQAADEPAVREMLQRLLGRAQRVGAAWEEAQWAQLWHDLREAWQCGLADRLPGGELGAQFLRALLLVHQYHLAAQLLPHHQGEQAAQVPEGHTAATVAATAEGRHAGADAAHQQRGAADAAAASESAAAAAAGLLPSGAASPRAEPGSAEAALSTLLGGGADGAGAVAGHGRFGVRKALHTAAGAAVSGGARLTGVAAGVIGTTANLVGSTAQAVSGTGGVVGATAGLVSGTASLVSSAATFAAAAATKAGHAAGAGTAPGAHATLGGVSGLLTPADAEAVVVAVSRELLAAAASLDDPSLRAAEAVLALLPEGCQAAAKQRASVSVLRRLPEFGVSLLPAQLTSLPDCRLLLQRVLLGRTATASAGRVAVAPWRRLGDVLELAAMLGMDGQEQQLEVRLLAAEAALDAGEAGIAEHLALGLAAAGYPPAWRLAAEMALPERYAEQGAERAAHAQELRRQQEQVEQQLASERQQQPTPPANPTAASAAVPARAPGGSDSADVATPPGTPTPGTPGGSEGSGAPAAAAGAAAGSDGGGGPLSLEEGPGNVEAAAAAASAGPHADGSGAAGEPRDSEAAAEAAAEGAAHAPSAPATPTAAAAAKGSGGGGTGEVYPLGPASLRQQQQQQQRQRRRSSTSGSAPAPMPLGTRQQLLAFAARHCPAGELPPITDELLAVQQELGGDQRRRGRPAAEQDRPEPPPTPELQERRELRLAVNSAARAGTALGGLPSLGDAHLLLGLLLKGARLDAAERAVDALVAEHIGAAASGGAAPSFSCLQRLLGVGAAAQLLLALQRQGAAALEAAGVQGVGLAGPRQLPQRQRQLQQLLLQPLGELRREVGVLQQGGAAEGEEREAAAAGAAAASGFMSRLQQLADGRQLKQWLPDVDTARFLGGDKAYQEQVVVQLASKAGQLAVQPPGGGGGGGADAAGGADADLLMQEAQALAAAYGADSWQLPMWYVHSVLVYSPDVTQPATQALLAAHAPVLLQRPAAAAAHLFSATYPLLPAAAANHAAATLGLVTSCLREAAGADGAGGSAAAISAALQPLDKLKELLSKSSRALSGLAVKQLVAGQVALMVAPAVAAVAAAATGSEAQLANGATEQQQQQQQGQEEEQRQRHEGEPQPPRPDPGAAQAAEPSVDVPLLLLEAAGAVAAYVSTPAQAAAVSKFVRHLQVISEMYARACGSKPLQQQLARLASGAPPGLPHLLLAVRALGDPAAPTHEQRRRGGDDEDEGEAGAERGSGARGSFYSAGGGSGSGGGAACAAAAARYAGLCGRQQLPRCSALHLVSLANWLALHGPQPLPEEAVGRLQPVPMGPALRLQMLDDVITLLVNPEAQLRALGAPGAGAGAAVAASVAPSPMGSRSSSFSMASSTGDLAASAAAAGALDELEAAAAAWRPPALPPGLAPRRRELLLPLLQEATRIAAAQRAAAALSAAGLGDGGCLSAALACEVSATPEDGGAEQQPGAAEPPPALAPLVRQLLSSGQCCAAEALQLAANLCDLQLALAAARGPDQAAAAAAAAAASQQQGGDELPQPRYQHSALAAVSAAVGQLAAAALSDLQAHLAKGPDGGDAAAAGGEPGAAADPSAAGGNGVLSRFEGLLGCLGPEQPRPAQPSQADAADSAEAAPEQRWLRQAVRALRCQLWQQLQEHQAQLPADAYSSPLVAGLLELQEDVCTGKTWPGWAVAAGGGGGREPGSGGGAAGAEDAALGDLRAASGTGLLLARTLTSLSKQFPGLKATADDVSSAPAACALFSRVLAGQPAGRLRKEQLAALQALLTGVWREGDALPAGGAPDEEAAEGQAAAAADGQAPAAAEAAPGAGAAEPSTLPGAEQTAEQEVAGGPEAPQDQLSLSVGLPEGACRLSKVHSCWAELLGAMLACGREDDLLAVLDGVAARAAAAAATAGAADSASAEEGAAAAQGQQRGREALVLPVTEVEAEQLLGQARSRAGAACAAALGLLMPYRRLQEAAVADLAHGRAAVPAGDGAWATRLLVLLLLRGQLAQLHAVGEHEQQPGTAAAATGQLLELLRLLLHCPAAAAAAASVAPSRAAADGQQAAAAAPLLLRCLLPHAVAQLCLADDYASAAALVAARVRFSAGLSMLQGALLVLERYLAVVMHGAAAAAGAVHRHEKQGGGGGGGAAGLPRCEQWLERHTAVAAHAAHTQLVRSMAAQD